MSDEERYTASMDPKNNRNIKANNMFFCQTKMTINAIKNVVTSMTVMQAIPEIIDNGQCLDSVNKDSAKNKKPMYKKDTQLLFQAYHRHFQ
jgi:hypothetical protein